MIRRTVAATPLAQECPQPNCRLELACTLRADLDMAAKRDLDRAGYLPIGEQEDEALDSPAVHGVSVASGSGSWRRSVRSSEPSAAVGYSLSMPEDSIPRPVAESERVLSLLGSTSRR